MYGDFQVQIVPGVVNAAEDSESVERLMFLRYYGKTGIEAQRGNTSG